MTMTDYVAWVQTGKTKLRIALEATDDETARNYLRVLGGQLTNGEYTLTAREERPA